MSAPATVDIGTHWPWPAPAIAGPSPGVDEAGSKHLVELATDDPAE